MYIQKIKINIKIIDHKRLKGIASVDFGDFRVKGFRIYVSEYKNDRGEELWIIPPSYKDSSGSYHPIFYAPDKNLWKQIEFKILDEYHKASEEHLIKQFDLDKQH